jgi:hypothetical protein
MSSEPEREPCDADEIPRVGFWAAMPKRTLSRVFILLALFVAIVYLQRRAGSIAAFMSDVFQTPRAAESGGRNTVLDGGRRSP